MFILLNSIFFGRFFLLKWVKNTVSIQGLVNKNKEIYRKRVRYLFLDPKLHRNVVILRIYLCYLNKNSDGKNVTSQNKYYTQKFFSG